ncbi:STAS domain-containing protein [Antrihabitans cavernicola]|uniref:Anti-sigma factor antagonist n=1 Tax=Antrihabitans cavernicola TaxID=2495913 RepID=A0A5A7S2I5_9NOCA|nr:STAS domain-containing protein [Spelaeibacter cavernicola]KAA0017367.1 STAS domain-containing protein [Spelaeibacter cavernicola]
MSDSDAVSGGATPFGSQGFEIAVAWNGRIVVLSVFGSLDMVSAPQLSESILNALANKPAAIIVDLTGVEFLASAGMTVLVAANEQAKESVPFGVVADGPAIGRPMKMVGLDKELTMYSTVDAALAAMSAA